MKFTLVHYFGALTAASALAITAGLLSALWHADAWAQWAFGLGLISFICNGLCLIAAWVEENE